MIFQCHLFTYGHLVDFSQNYTRDLSQHSGTFLMHKNKLSDFQVQARLKPVTIPGKDKRVAQSCAVFVREGPDIVMVDNCGDTGPVKFMATLSRESDYRSKFKMLEGRGGSLLMVSSVICNGNTQFLAKQFST